MVCCFSLFFGLPSGFAHRLLIWAALLCSRLLPVSLGRQTWQIHNPFGIRERGGRSTPCGTPGHRNRRKASRPHFSPGSCRSCTSCTRYTATATLSRSRSTQERTSDRTDVL
uniref:Secreted protein n=1 Tax=Anguilla anguilla TaxID=7936 RepID=A0A0E9VFP6_ANGAN